MIGDLAQIKHSTSLGPVQTCSAPSKASADLRDQKIKAVRYIGALLYIQFRDRIVLG